VQIHTNVYFSLFKNDQTQLVVLLERLLERAAIATATLTQLDNCYHFAQKNAEVGLTVQGPVVQSWVSLTPC
jgi:hypothetical protein